MIKTASLRIYVPADDPQVAGLPLATTVRIDPVSGRFGILGESQRDDALEAAWDGERYRCPRTPRLRTVEGVLAVRTAYRELGAAQVVPEQVALAAADELERITEEHPGSRTHILTSAWHVPLRWFVPFTGSDRDLIRSDGRVTIRYRTDLDDATARLRRCLDILAATDLTDALSVEVEDLLDWLERFPEDAMVELDYGTVADRFPPADLAMDESASEVWDALMALEEGQMDEAVSFYTRLAERWAPAMAVAYSN